MNRSIFHSPQSGEHWVHFFFSASRWWVFLFAVMIAILGGCAEKEKKPLLPQPNADEVLFSTAEQFYKEKSYDKSLEAFQAYMSKYSQKPMADSALMRLGALFSVKGDFNGERDAYQRLVSEYPKSPYVADARMAILSSYYKEGNYPATTDYANRLLKDIFLPKTYFARIYMMLGDIQTVTGPIRGAVTAYAQAYQVAQSTERQAIKKQFDSAISQLERSDIETYLSSPPSGDLGKFLLYELGKGLLEAKREKEAVSVLSKTLQLFPDHPRSTEIHQVLDKLTRQSAPQKFVIGCLLPLSGTYKAYGEQALKGIELALNGVNEKKSGLPIEIVVKDGGSDPSKTAAAAKALCDAKVAAIIGPMLNAREAAEEAQKSAIPMITLTGKEGIGDAGDHVFRNFITPQMQVDALVSYSSNILKLKRFAILYPDEKYGNTLMNLFWDKVIEYGGIITGAESYKPDATDFSEPIKKLTGKYYDSRNDTKNVIDPSVPVRDKTVGGAVQNTAAGTSGKQDESNIIDFNALFIPDGPGKIRTILPQLSFYDVERVILLGTNLWHSKELVESAEGKLEGALVPDGFFVESELPQVKAFVEAFKAAYNAAPGFIEAVSYDTAMMLFALAEDPAALKGDSLRDKIVQIRDFQGVTGRTSFNEQGEAVKSLSLLEIHRNRFRALSDGN
jgi:branched-chain amino acid transport system substrate-binding protein